MASIKQRGKTWEYSVSNYTNGKYDPIRKGGFATEKECRIAAAEVELAKEKGKKIKVKFIPFVEFFTDFVTRYKSHLRGSTTRSYNSTINHIKDFFKDTPIQKITRQNYQDFINFLAKDKAVGTVNKIHVQIKECAYDAVENGYIGNNFTYKARIHGCPEKTKSKEEKYLDFADSQKLLNYLLSNLDTDHPINHLILLAILTGLRYGELVGLKRSSFDFTTNTIAVIEAWDHTYQSGHTELKNASSIRTVQISKDYMTDFKKLIIAKTKDVDDLVFRDWRKPRLKSISNQDANDRLREITKFLGIKSITMHALRHTHASLLLYKEIDIYAVSERLGHANVSTTQNTYTHVLKEMRQRSEAASAQIFDDMKMS